METLIDEAIEQLHSAEPSRGILKYKREIKESLLKHRRYSERQNQIVDHRGVKVNLKDDLRSVIDASPFIPRKADISGAKYLAPWTAPDEEVRKKYNREMTSVIERLLNLEGFVASDQQAVQKATSIIARNFLYETDDSGNVVFRKINSNGLLGSQQITFGELSTFLYPLIDQDKSRLASEFKQSERIELAKKLLNQANPPKQLLQKKVDELRKNEIALAIPRKKLPELSRSKVEKEFLLQESVLRGLDASNLSPTHRSQLQNVARSAFDELSNTFEIKRELESIKPNPSGSWENLTYEI